MSTPTIDPATETETPTLSPRLAFLLAAASGLIVANMYYAQPLVGVIGGSLGLVADSDWTRCDADATRLRRGPPSDCAPRRSLWNRRLILLLATCCILSLAGAALSSTAGLSFAPLLLWASVPLSFRFKCPMPHI